MKKNIFFSSVLATLIITGCATTGSSLSPQEAAKKGGLKEYITENNKNNYNGIKIYADTPTKTILRTRIYNQNGVGISDIYEVTKQLSNYCESIGGKWIYGRQYGFLLNKYRNVYVNPIIALTSTNQQIKAEKSNYAGFGKCEASNQSFNVEYELGRFAINKINWSRFYKVTFSTPQKMDNYIVRSNNTLLTKNKYFKNWENFIKKATISNISAFGKGANFIANSYPICLKYGGKMYISNYITGNKTEDFNNYIFKRLDMLYKKYPYGTDNGAVRELSLFSVDNTKIWCENPNKPQYQFTLVSQKDSYGWIEYKFKPYLDKNVSTGTKKYFKRTFNIEVKNIQNQSSGNRNIDNIAKALFISKSDYILTTQWVTYKGYYIGNINGCSYVSIEKIERNSIEIYNYKKCNGSIQFTGKTLQGLTQAEMDRFKPYLNDLINSCEINKKGFVGVNGYIMYCKYLPAGSARIFILDNKFRLIDIFK